MSPDAAAGANAGVGGVTGFLRLLTKRGRGRSDAGRCGSHPARRRDI